MSGTELERAADRLVGEPTLTAPSLDGITARADQRRRRRRGAFGGGVMAAVMAVGGVIVLQNDEPVPVVATSGLAVAEGAASDEGGVGDEPSEDSDAGDGPLLDEKDSWSKLGWFGGELDLTIEHHPFDQTRADDLAAAADETIELDGATAYVTRGDDRVSVAVVGGDKIIEIDAPTSLVPDEGQLRELAEKLAQGDLWAFGGDLFGDEKPKWLLDDDKAPFGLELPPADATPEELEQWMRERVEKFRAELPLPEDLEDLDDFTFDFRFDKDDFPFELPPSDATPEELEEWLKDRFDDFDFDLEWKDGEREWKLDFDTWDKDDSDSDDTDTDDTDADVDDDEDDSDDEVDSTST